MRPRTSVYIDGFNLYFRALKDTAHRWLDLRKLSEFLLPEYQVETIRYFTAIVESRPGDPQQQQRQQIYLRALATVPGLTIHYGTFVTNIKRLPLAKPVAGRPKTIEVLRTEEKGSDVNLATHLLADGFRGEYEVAVVISNDSDLIEPIRVVREELSLLVGVAITDPNTRRSALPADFHRRVRAKQLRACQVPDQLRDDTGVFRKPADW